MEIKSGLRKSKKDIRDFNYTKAFGAIDVSYLPKEFYVSQPLEIKDQQGTDFCTSFSAASVREDTEELLLDPLWLWSQAAKIRRDYKSWGMDLRTGAKAVVKGILEKQESPFGLDKERDFLANWENWPEELKIKADKHKAMSYFWIDTDNLFDNIRIALYQNKDEKRSVWTGCDFKFSWLQKEKGIIDDYDSKETSFGHAIKIYGWKEINNETYLVAQLSNGNIGDNGLMYFNKKVINSPLFRFGALTFKDFDPIEYKKLQWTLLQLMYDYLKLLQLFIILKYKKLGLIWKK